MQFKSKKHHSSPRKLPIVLLIVKDMKHLWKRSLLICLPVAIILVGFSVFAIGICQPTGPQYCNPLGNVTDIPSLIEKFLSQLLLVTIPLAGFGIILAGLLYVFAAVSGNPSKTATAKKTFTYVLLGAILIVGANALVVAIIKFLNPVVPPIT